MDRPRQSSRPGLSGNVKDLFEGLHGRPIVGQGGAEAEYVGRVIVELWEKPGSTDSQMLAYSVYPVSGNSVRLMDRIVSALPIRFNQITNR